MRNTASKRFKAFRIGPLPAKAINSVMDTELDVAVVWVSKACHQHMAFDHPNDYPIIIANIVDIIREPSMVGQDPKHGKNFYLVKKVPDNDGKNFSLVAIGLEISKFGTYNVKSAYIISQSDVTNRRLKGALKLLIPK